MSESPNFANNPFAALAQTLAAAKKNEAKSAPISVGPAVSSGTVHVTKSLVHATPWQKPAGSAFAQSQAAACEDVDDSALFLQSVQNVCPAAAQHKRALPSDQWRLADSVELPNMSKSAQKLKRPTAEVQSALVPSTKASEATQRKPVIQGGKTLHDMTDKANRPDMIDGAAMPNRALIDAATPADEQTFLRAMREVQPLTGKGRDVPLEVEPSVNAEQAANLLQDFMDGKLEFALSLTGEYLEGYVVGLDEITMNKLRAGQYSPEAHLDLHGLNAVQAYQALVGFFRSAWYKGMRTLLVVPGRGRNSLDGIGILRDKLQDWLTQEPFRRVVLAFCTARPADGGPGSVYVLLRRYRRKGKIFWERTPTDPDLF